MYTKVMIIKGLIPPEYAEHIKERCECAWPIERTLNLRQAWCSNPNCPYHEKNKAVTMLKYLGVKDIGPAKGEILLKQNGVKNHIDLIPKLYTEKPCVYLWEIALLVAIPGYESKLQDLFKGFKTMQEFVDSQRFPADMLPYKSILLRAENYFNIKPELSEKEIVIMMTGSLTGYGSRENFVQEVNNKLGNYISVKLVSKRASNVHYLVTERKDSTSTKAVLARKNNIPIVTPAEFLAIIKAMVLKQ